MSQDTISHSVFRLVRLAVEEALQTNNVTHYDIAEEENMYNILVVIGSYSDREMIADAVTSVFCDDDTAKITTAHNESQDMTTCVVSYENGIVITQKTDPKLMTALNKITESIEVVK